MSLLPQRKKSPEEIAKLRENLGIPGSPPGENPAPPPADPTATASPLTEPGPHPQAAATPVSPRSEPAPPAPAHHGPKPVHSLKRSERIPILPPDDPQPAPPPVAVSDPPALVLKPVRSLRKSELIPLPVVPHAAPPADSPLPSHRHSDHELNEIRRREALAMLNPVVNPKFAAAHPALLVPGYLAPLAAAAACAFYQQPITVTAPCAAASLLIATFISIKKPVSRHHAAFIAVITLFVIVFGALHYFPQLRHAT